MKELLPMTRPLEQQDKMCYNYLAALGKIMIQGDPEPFRKIPAVTMYSPTSAEGWVGTFSGCKYDWVCITKLSMLAVSTETHFIDIVENPTTGAIEATDCREGYPINDLVVLNRFFVNFSNDAETYTWGAVKSIYR